MRPYRKTPLRSDRIAKQKRKKRIITLTFSFVLLILFFITIYFVTRIKSFLIVDISLDGNKTIDEEKVIEKINENISKNYFYFLVPRKNIFFYPKNTIKKDLLLEFPRIESVDVAIVEKNMKVSIVEKKPSGIWCTENNKCFFFDKTGELYAESPDISGYLFREFRGILTEDAKLRDVFLGEDTIKKIDEFDDFLSESNIKVVSIDVKSLSEVRVLTDSIGTIIYSLDKEYLPQEKALLGALSSDRLKDKSEYSNIDYIDIRFGNKVFFKERDINSSDVSEESEETDILE